MKHFTRAFTLIEVVIVIGLFAIMMIALYTFFISANSAQVFQTAYINTSGSASDVVEGVASAVLPARGIVTSHSFSTGTLSTDADSLAVELPSVDSAGAVISGKYDYIGFYRDGAGIYQVTDADASSARFDGRKTLSGVGHSLSFAYDNADVTESASVVVSVETRSVIKTQTVADQFERTVYLRNKP